ncbi:Bro-N domain-containing protein [Anaeromusa sp.]|uniref:BRO-N domain-containing protein n=1 Tax=Anaeromusa sp. TaxID=1872520 RepID=UPI00263550BE|nr:Bro-N domain-containing protein [Anaeromusa sp.]MDD3157040.1 Bro-N domain-containing protein [Anaeromusa sp.]
MSDLVLAKSEVFRGVTCDFWRNEDTDSYFMTSDQLGSALGYANPRQAISKVVDRNAYLRTEEFSGVVKMGTPSGEQETRVFTEDGIYEVTMLAKTQIAREFRARVRKILKELRKGTVKAFKQIDPAIIEARNKNAQARLMNARRKDAEFLIQKADSLHLSPVAAELLKINAVEMIAGKGVLPRPQVDRLYSASDIALEAGTNRNNVGKAANANNLKTDEYGMMVLGQSEHSAKQMPTFMYNEKGKAKLLEILKK